MRRLSSAAVVALVLQSVTSGVGCSDPLMRGPTPATSRAPLTFSPSLTAIPAQVLTPDQSYPQVAASQAQFLVTWEESSGGGSSVLGELFDANGCPSGTILPIPRGQGQSFTAPGGHAVASDGTNFLVATCDTKTSGTGDIWVHLVWADGGMPADAGVDVCAAFPNNDANPCFNDLAHVQAASSGANYLVTWISTNANGVGTEVAVAVVGTDGTLIHAGFVIGAAATGARSTDAPMALAWLGSDAGAGLSSYAVAEYDGSSTIDISTLVVNGNGLVTVSFGATVMDAEDVPSSDYVSMAGDGAEYLVTWADRIGVSSATVVPGIMATGPTEVVLHGGAPSTSWDGANWVVASSQGNGDGGNLVTLTTNGFMPITYPSVVAGGAGGTPKDGVSVASMVASGVSLVAAITDGGGPALVVLSAAEVWTTPVCNGATTSSSSSSSASSTTASSATSSATASTSSSGSTSTAGSLGSSASGVSVSSSSTASTGTSAGSSGTVSSGVSGSTSSAATASTGASNGPASISSGTSASASAASATSGTSASSSGAGGSSGTGTSAAGSTTGTSSSGHATSATATATSSSGAATSRSVASSAGASSGATSATHGASSGSGGSHDLLGCSSTPGLGGAALAPWLIAALALTRRRRGMVATLAILALARPALAETPEDRARAQTLVEDGARFFSEEKYQQSLDRFRAAYQIYPSHKILFNVAQAQYRLGEPAEAARSYEEYLRTTEHAGESAMEFRKTAATNLAVLQKVLGRLKVICDPPEVQILVDGQSSPSATIYVAPGKHSVAAVSKSHTLSADVEVAAGQQLEVHLPPTGPAVAAGTAGHPPAGDGTSTSTAVASSSDDARTPVGLLGGHWVVGVLGASELTARGGLVAVRAGFQPVPELQIRADVVYTGNQNVGLIPSVAWGPWSFLDLLRPEVSLGAPLLFGSPVRVGVEPALGLVVEATPWMEAGAQVPLMVLLAKQSDDRAVYLLGQLWVAARL